jgi:serine acetyltransferase
MDMAGKIIGRRRDPVLLAAAERCPQALVRANGARTVINRGCQFLDNAPIAIGAGSIVTRDIPPMVVALGQPARVVRRLG